MVGGFNTNIRYKGRVFHVQTEDSGPTIAKIVTLLYEGGSILSSRKTAYTAADANVASVRALMEKQHREVAEALRAGELDAEIASGQGGAQPAGKAPAAASAPGRDAAAAASAKNGASAPAAAAPSAASRAAEKAAPEKGKVAAATREFGHGVITTRTLDEVILSHLGSK